MEGNWAVRGLKTVLRIGTKCCVMEKPKTKRGWPSEIIRIRL
jgi:hypothetical protein